MPTLRRSLVVSILFTVFGGPGIVLVYVPYWITRFRIPAAEPLWQMLLAAALILIGLVPLFDSIQRFIFVGRGTLVPGVPTEHLVIGGLYRYVRNPMYVGVLTALAGEMALFRSVGLAVEGAAGFAATQIFILFYEEPTLTRRYGEEYARYKRHVRRWLPRIKPWNGTNA